MCLGSNGSTVDILAVLVDSALCSRAIASRMARISSTMGSLCMALPPREVRVGYRSLAAKFAASSTVELRGPAALWRLHPILELESWDLRVVLLIIRDEDRFDGKRVTRNQRIHVTDRSPSACKSSGNCSKR